MSSPVAQDEETTPMSRRFTPPSTLPNERSTRPSATDDIATAIFPSQRGRCVCVCIRSLLCWVRHVLGRLQYQAHARVCCQHNCFRKAQPPCQNDPILGTNLYMPVRQSPCLPADFCILNDPDVRSKSSTTALERSSKARKPSIPRPYYCLSDFRPTFAGMSYRSAAGRHMQTKHAGMHGSPPVIPLEPTHAPQQARLWTRTACPRPPHRKRRRSTSSPGPPFPLLLPPLQLQLQPVTAVTSARTGSSKYSTRASSRM